MSTEPHGKRPHIDAPGKSAELPTPSSIAPAQGTGAAIPGRPHPGGFPRRYILGLMSATAALLLATMLKRYLGWKRRRAEPVVFPRRDEDDPAIALASGVIVVGRAPGAKALSARCTHLGCQVQPSPDGTRLVCPCHGSEYDLKGKVIHGPARDDLEDLPLEYLDNGSIRVEVT